MENNSFVSHDCLKYLGVNMVHKLNFETNTFETKKKCTTKSKHIRSLTLKNAGSSTETAAHIYVTLF